MKVVPRVDLVQVPGHEDSPEGRPGRRAQDMKVVPRVAGSVIWGRFVKQVSFKPGVKEWGTMDGE